jgi:hypothetical protein
LYYSQWQAAVMLTKANCRCQCKASGCQTSSFKLDWIARLFMNYALLDFSDLMFFCAQLAAAGVSAQ